MTPSIRCLLLPFPCPETKTNVYLLLLLLRWKEEEDLWTKIEGFFGIKTQGWNNWWFVNNIPSNGPHKPI